MSAKSLLRTAGRLFFLDLGGGRVFSANPDGMAFGARVEVGTALPSLLSS